MEITKHLIEKINKIFSKNDMEAFLALVSDDVVWEMHSSSTGHNMLKGKEEVARMDLSKMPEKMNFQFRTVIIEGEVAAVDGTNNGITPDGKQFDSNFCDIYNFKDGKVAKLTSYVIDNL